MVLARIPEGTKVHHGASQTLDVTGITREVETSGRYEPIGPRIRSMDRATQGDEIRRESTAPDVMLGSVHAVTETGSLMAASSSGSQLAAYVAGAGRVILVVGTQKIVRDLEEGLRRIGFGEAAPGVHVRTPAQIAAEQQLFFDMRHVSRAFEQLGGESVRQLAEDQYERGWHRRREHPRRVKLVGDVAHGRIVLVDVKETNGHTGNGRLQGVVMDESERSV